MYTQMIQTHDTSAPFRNPSISVVDAAVSMARLTFHQIAQIKIKIKIRNGISKFLLFSRCFTCAASNCLNFCDANRKQKYKMNSVHITVTIFLSFFSSFRAYFHITQHTNVHFFFFLLLLLFSIFRFCFCTSTSSSSRVRLLFSFIALSLLFSFLSALSKMCPFCLWSHWAIAIGATRR